MQSLEKEVQAMMESNRRKVKERQFTIPSPELYPFQWLWDSCFHAIILLNFDIPSAKEELRSVFSHPLPSGMLPHIIYWSEPDVPVGNWGRELRGNIINDAWGVIGTSSITQPSIMALAVRRVFEKDGDTDFVKEIYPTLKAHFEYLARERSVPGFEPLVAIVNPDESGEDNSPRFDDALKLPPIHIPDMHLDARLALMKQYATCKFALTGCMDKHFLIIDVPFNILYAEDLEHLSCLADALGCRKESDTYHARATSIRTAIRKRLLHKGVFQSYDALHKKYVAIETWAAFMPLYGGLLSQSEAGQLVEALLLNPEKFKTPYMVPTVARTEHSFDPGDGFWRGPVWFAPNWFIYKGLKRYGFEDLAQELKARSKELLEKSGFREQYNPLTGEGKGGHNFTWGGLILDMA